MSLAQPDRNKVRVAQTNVKDRSRRELLTKEFMRSEFYSVFFEPEILKEIEMNDRLSKISESNDPAAVFQDFWKQKNKVQIYRGILNKLKEWASNSNSSGGN